MARQNADRPGPAPDGAMSRRFVLQAGGVSALGLLIAACGGVSTGEQWAEGPTGPPVRGGDLVFAMSMNFSTLDPAFSQNTTERFAYYAIYNTLVAYDKDFNIVPELAEKWETSKDGKRLTLHLRRGVRFHDGTAFDAEAVKWNLDRILDRRTNSPLRGSLTPPLEAVEVVDDATVELNLATAWRPLLAALGERPGFMVSPAAVQKYGADYGVHPVGTGPFEFVGYTADSELKLKRFNGYWDPGKVHLDSITFKNTPEQQVQLTMLRTGEAHLTDPITPQLALTIQKDSGVALKEARTGSWYALQMDCDKPPFNRPELRQAIAHATNREGVRSAIYRGKARVATGPTGIGWAYFEEDTLPVYPYDLNRARQLVQQAGAAGLTVNYVNSSDSDYQAIAQLLQGDYAKIGLKVKVGTVPGSDYYNNVVDDKIGWSLTQWTPRADPDGLLRTLLYSKGGQNSTGYSNPEVDRLLDEAAGVLDNAEAAKIYRRIQRIVEKDAPYVWVVWPNALVPHSSGLGGVTLYPDAIYRLREMWISR
ncbi:ABC transporter substrate-binding protein [Actinomadura rugatobispora]|uniref:ABC transporter substrate-binding protein n=1 Tax=Actinomadura rugatobispora TaxID=1994 RepID=A0ABW0ZXT8_9ACTN|nr:glutathione ABC transporter substrate-binding protein GsiB [Actinomadura rugatobispora]